MAKDLKNGNRKFYIEEFEKIMTEQIKPSKEINLTLGWAYVESVENKNDYLNFYDTIWAKDIAPIVETCRKYGIADFERYGCKVCGLTKANRGCNGKAVSAIKLQVL